MFRNLQKQLNQSIHTAEQKYFNKITKKLCDPLTSTKCYWSFKKILLNIPPIFHNNKYKREEFTEKRGVFKSSFAN